jgi:uncharacterized coiled-coil protein SlyX
MSKQETEKTGKKIEITVELPLTDKAKAERGLQAAKLFDEIEATVAEKKQVMFEYRQKLAGQQEKLKELLEQFQTGKELTTVKAQEVKNFTNNVVEFWYKGEIVKSRPMNFADRQTEMPVGKSAAPAVEKPFEPVTTIKKGRTKKAGKPEEAKTEGEHIADVIRAEKSRTGKHSAVDGPTKA